MILHNRFLLDKFEKEELIDYIEKLTEYYIDKPIQKNIDYLEEFLYNLLERIEGLKDTKDKEIIESNIEDLQCEGRFLSKKIEELKMGKT